MAAGEQVDAIVQQTNELVQARTFPWSELPELVQGLVRLVVGWRDDSDRLFPWLGELASPPRTDSLSVEGRKVVERLMQIDNLAALIASPAAVAEEIAGLRGLLDESAARESAASESAARPPEAAEVKRWLDELARQIESSAAAARELDR